MGIGLALSSLLLTLLCVEGALRVYHFVRSTTQSWRLPPPSERAMIPSDDTALAWRFNPGWVQDGFSVNAFAMANRETTLRKPSGVYRLAFVGDSISAGFGQIAREHLYLNVAADLLNQRADGGPRIESLNFAVNGYSILQSLRMAEAYVPPFDPDVLVIQLCLNDAYPMLTVYAPGAPEDPFRLRAFLLRRLRSDLFYAHLYAEHYFDARGWANLRRGFEGFARLARDGPPLLAILFPYLYRPAYARWGYGELHRGLEDLAHENGIPLIDLREAFDRTGVIGDDWPMDPIHPDARGHRIAAQILVRALGQRGLLPPGARSADAS